MKKLLKILLIIFGVIIAVIILFALLLLWLSRQPAVKENYFENVHTEMPLEQKYTTVGDYDVQCVEYFGSDENGCKFKLWYPSEILKSERKYPAVIMVNGTGVPAAKYEPIFKHLASWGFVVVGNDDDNSWSGKSSCDSLRLLLEKNEDKNSKFFGKIDTESIGIAGHSQGAVGAINAVTEFDNGRYYSAVYIASATHTQLAEALGWSYHAEKLGVPCFFTAGTLPVDAGDENNEGIAPLWSIKENYDKIGDNTIKVYARRRETDHGDMLANADGYMTAWFMYLLCGDNEAEQVFAGENAEILFNPNWQDAEKNR